MAYLASNLLPQEGYTESKRIALRLKGILQARNQELLSDTNADVIISIFYDTRSVRDRLLVIAAIPGISVYAQDQEDDATYDVVAEFNALVTSLNAVLSNIYNTFPKDLDGYLLEKSWDVNGDYVYRQFTPAQTVTLRGLIDTVIAGIV